MAIRHPILPPTPDYTPFRPDPFRLAMGLVPLDLQDWIEPDDQMATDLAEKERLCRERHHEVFAALPAADTGSTEVLECLAAHLPNRFPTLYRRVDGCLDNLVTGQRWNLIESGLHPLDLAGRLVQEDLCLMRREEDAETYSLVGASVCFPTRWRLADKMGKSVDVIHNPVPEYEAKLGATMNRFFSRLKTKRPVWRLNWSLTDNPTLFQPTGHGRSEHNTIITDRNAGETVWLRIERQTLRRLPRTGDILFTIRVYVRPLHTLASHPQQAAALAAAIRVLPPSMQQYKSLLPFREAVLTWLDKPAASTSRLNQKNGAKSAGSR